MRRGDRCGPKGHVAAVISLYNMYSTAAPVLRLESDLGTGERSRPASYASCASTRVSAVRLTLTTVDAFEYVSAYRPPLGCLSLPLASESPSLELSLPSPKASL